MKSFARLLADNGSNVARGAINLHSLAQTTQTFERMLTQMELMHNRRGSRSSDLDSRRANCRDINHTTRALRASPSLREIVLSRDSHRQHLPGRPAGRPRNPRRRVLAIASAMYLRDRNNTTPDLQRRKKTREPEEP